jgi:ribonucleoside-diphosphate reductase alpha chain
MSKVYNEKEAYEKSLKYFNNNDLAAGVFLSKYALRDENGNILEPTPKEMHRRLAKEFARIEKEKYKNTKIVPYTEEEIYNKLEGFKQIIPQGSPMSAIGNKYQISSASNCYVADAPEDSYGGIMHTDQQLVQLSKRRAGVGTDVSKLRPKGMKTKNAARTTTGIIPFCERYSNSIREVGQNGRRGALMITCDIRHPESVKLYCDQKDASPIVIRGKVVDGMKQRDIKTTSEFYNESDLDFCSMKLDSTRVTGANVSLRLTDEFLECVKKGTKFVKRFPIDCKPEDALYTEEIDARRAWEKIIHCAWQRAEPGILFWDHITNESPADCYKEEGFETICTNPCGEIPLNSGDSCRLLVVNLFGCVVNPYTEEAYFDFEKLEKDAYFAQRLMDDLVDLELERVDQIIHKIESDPEDEELKKEELELWKKIRKNCELGRRTGTGIVALGDAIAASNVKYGSDESIEVCDKIYKTLKIGSYSASVDMAKELGPFPIWDWEREKNNPFIKRIKEEKPELYNNIKKYGRRNIANLTTAPTGSVALLTQLIIGYFGSTGGIEPNYSNVPYVRKKKINPDDKDARVDSKDQNGDCWQHFKVYPSGIKAWMDVTGEEDIKKSPYHEASAEEIDWKQRVKFQAAAQRHVDHSISSTVNLPSDVTEEKVSEIYQTAWENNLKGITVYRDGCRTGVLVKETDPEENEDIHVQTKDAPKRPKVVESDIYIATAKGEKYIIAVGLLNGDQPYEIFGGKANGFGIKKTCKGKVIKHKKGQYGIEIGDLEIEDFSKHFTPQEQTIFRLASTLMRHGVPIEYVVDQMQKSTDDMFSLPSAVARVLKKYIKDGQKVTGQICDSCGSEDLVYIEGCVTCRACGNGKCG